MYKTAMYLTIVCVLILFDPANAIEIYEPGYKVEVYAVYQQSAKTRGMAFDDAEYLYITHYPPGAVWRIEPNGAASEFATIEYPRGVVWTGGTSFGSYLYVVDFETFRGDIMRVDQDGGVSHFTNLSGDGPTPIAVDRTGKYGGLMYVATRGDDRIYCIDTAGNESTFSNFPYSRDGGGPMSMAFDITGKYGGLLYISNSYTEDVADLSGLFSLDTEGIETRFTNDLVQVGGIAFSPDCTFGQYMYATGRSEFDGQKQLWRINPNGQATLFGSDCDEIVFGPDGNLYVSEFSEAEDLVTISRISKMNYYVDAVNGDDSNNGTSFRTAFATIQHGIDMAQEGYTILVNPGVYTEPIDFRGKAVTVQGLAGPVGIPVLEIPDDFAVFFLNNEGPDSVLKNMVIKNSYMAILIVGSSPTISNVTMVNNGYGIRAYVGADPDIKNCIFWNNLYGDLSGCVSSYSLTVEEGEGNICADPLFIDPDNGDYHLLSERGRYWPEHDVWVLDNVTSPCIDTGDPMDDPSCEPMPNGGFINMGAYGGTRYASMSEMPWPYPDVNRDGIIDTLDLAELVDRWLAAAGWIE